MSEILRLFWIKSTKQAQNFNEKFNSIGFYHLVCAQVKIFVSNSIHNDISIHRLSSIQCLVVVFCNSLFDAYRVLDYGGALRE